MYRLIEKVLRPETGSHLTLYLPSEAMALYSLSQDL